MTNCFWCVVVLPAVLLLSSTLQGRADDEAAPWPPVISNDASWKLLPGTNGGRGEQLPTWARMMVTELPKTTAAFLELDRSQRTQGAIAPYLRAAIRFVAAKENQCRYTMESSRFDGRVAGVDSGKWSTLEDGSYAGWTIKEKLALEFSRLMTVDSDSISDETFAKLVEQFGAESVACMVLHAAYANFQDRFLLCLNAPLESNGPLPPFRTPFVSTELVSKTTPPKTTETKGVKAPSELSPSSIRPSGTQTADSNQLTWLPYDQLQSRLELQRKRKTRLPILDWTAIASKLPPGLMDKPSDIVWYRIAFGYASELAVPFEYYMRTAGAEVSMNWDRIFGNSVFWMVTDAMKCPYCMGHCEMNWEVSGLDKQAIESRSRMLAGGDWSSFNPAEQDALEFSRRLTKAPSKITKSDIDRLRKGFGDQRALFFMLNASRYNYMTRISNGFQLTLESENVFWDYYNMKPTVASNAAGKANSTSTKEAAFVNVLSNEEAWAKLPALAEGTKQPLPIWARAIAVQMPRTAAAMLELDAAHRLYSPLKPSLRAKFRWVVAQSNRCKYTEAYALADLRRAGVDESEISSLITDNSNARGQKDEALEFARLLTLAAPTIPDSLFERLRSQYGNEGVAAMVLLAAYGNFQDRIVLGLNLPMEEGGPLLPANSRFVDGALQVAPLLPPENGQAKYIDSAQSVVPRDEAWISISYDQLQKRLNQQLDRKPRLPVPTWDEVKLKLPAAMSKSPTAIRWSLVHYGYAHKLAIPWTIATRTHWAECPADRILEESLFWVQTRAIECNYCMGHCEMLLEVAGLDRPAIAKRTQMLAETDWASFPPSEQRAYAFARKLSRAPWEMTKTDYQALEQDWGHNKAMGIFWWMCRGLYMTRISDGFQLPLERENVFGAHPQTVPEQESKK